MCLRECTAYRLLPQLGMLLALRRFRVADPIPCGVTHHMSRIASRKCKATSAVSSMAEVNGESALLSCGVCIAQMVREVIVAPLVSRSLSTSEEKSAVPSAISSNSYPQVRNHHAQPGLLAHV